MPQDGLEWLFIFLVIIALFMVVAIIFETVVAVLDEMRDDTIPHGWRHYRERRDFRERP